MLTTKTIPQKEGQVTVMSFFKFPRGKYWGMKQMMFTQNRLKGTPGLVFHKMLGTGGGSGYSFKPDFTTFALLTVWENLSLAIEFESQSEVMADFRDNASEVYSIFLSPTKARGFWSRQQPFQPEEADPDNKLMVVLTRATLKPKYYYHFWKRVSGVSESHIGAPGLLFSKGVGERPWIMQATFSIWESAEDMAAFAHHKGGKHYEAIKTTRMMGGFKEELYVRFQPIFTKGSWNGEDFLGEALAALEAEKRMASIGQEPEKIIA